MTFCALVLKLALAAKILSRTDRHFPKNTKSCSGHLKTCTFKKSIRFSLCTDESKNIHEFTGKATDRKITFFTGIATDIFAPRVCACLSCN